MDAQRTYLVTRLSDMRTVKKRASRSEEAAIKSGFSGEVVVSSPDQALSRVLRVERTCTATWVSREKIKELFGEA